MRPCFQFQAAATADAPAVLTIFDEIGFWGVQAKDFVRDLAAIEAKTIQVEINSPGGDVFAGLAIYNALKGSGKEIVTKVMGVAASAASVIFMAGDKRVAPKNTFVMVHNPWSFAMGNADELRDTADTLDKIGASLRTIYTSGTGLEDAEVAEMLSKDTWLTADEAKDKGFVTEVVDEVKANARFDMDRAELPEHVKAVFKAAVKADVNPEPAAEPQAEPAPPVEPAQDETPVAEQVQALAAQAGLSDYADVFAVACATVADAKARIALAREVKALCAVAKADSEAAGFIKAGTQITEVRASLVKAMAQKDETDHTNGTPKNQGSTTGNSATSGVSTDSIWKSHNAKK